MRKGISYLLLATCFLAVSKLQAQQFGGNPSCIRWQQINTDTARIIFPKGYETSARRIAAIIHTLQQHYTHTIGDTFRKVNIVLETQTLQSNGFVTLAPFHSEFYTTPPQNAFGLGAVGWNDNLAVHEFRHVQQYGNFNKGLSKAAGFILGEQGQEVANAAAVPDWFFEGDAVFNETKFTQQGRGSLPLFLSSYRSLYEAGIHYGYMKLRNGSYRQYVPDHYDLGYLLVAYGRKKYGQDIWRKVTDDAVRFTPFFYPFQGAVKKNMGESFPRFVADAFHFYEQQWQAEKNEQPLWLSAVQKNNVVSYQYPYLADDGSLIVLKSSYRSIPSFYKINGSKEEKIAVKNIPFDDYFSYNNGKIIYAAYQPDTRWGYLDHNVITVLDVRSHRERTIDAYVNYFSPDISHDGSKMVAVQLDSVQASGIVVMNDKGERQLAVHSPSLIFSYPKFTADDAYVFAAARKRDGSMSILKYSIVHPDETQKTILPFSNRIIGFLQVQGDTLLFSTTYNGRDEIWAYIDNTVAKGPYRLASYATGLYQGTLQPDGNLVASTFTANGYRLGQYKPAWERMEIKDALTDLYVTDAYGESDHHLLDSILPRTFPVSGYPKASHLLNFHSWRPYYDRPEYSFTVYGDNMLNTFHSEIAYTYNQNEGSSKLGFNGVFGGSYVQPLFGVSQTWNRTGLISVNSVLQTVHWNELGAYAGLRLPLNISGGKQYRFLTLQTTFNTDRLKWAGDAQQLLRDMIIDYIDVGIGYSGQIQQSVQQMYPHWAQSFNIRYRSAVNNHTAHQLLLTGSLYLPGISASHSLVLSAAFSLRDTMNQYIFSDNFPFSRGYAAVDFPRTWQIGANYHFPLVYPEAGVGNIVYLKRVRANIFYDYTDGQSLRTGNHFLFGTAGAELYLDTRWWNQQPVTFGLRYSRLLNREFSGVTRPDVWEFILPVRLFE